MMLPLLTSDLYKYLALAALLLAIAFGYLKGRGAASAGGRPLTWTRTPLIAFAIASLGPSAFAILIYLGYTAGLMQPPASGYRFSSYIADLPLDFAVINWGFVALYVTCRLRPNLAGARLAMWLSVIAMALPNILLFSLAWTMVSTAFDAGQGIGIIEAVLSVPMFMLFWSGPFPDIFNPESGVGFVTSTLLAPIPVLGLTGWLAGRLMGRAAAKATVRS
ncbi:MAG TPA: hypothetical protein VFW22_15225 [Pseudolabrys sp.]|nr:hypothetical protein [Pseudolabrys sp.]